MITDLTYEEVVLLQNIMIGLDEGNSLFDYDQEIFDSLYEKVMNS